MPRLATKINLHHWFQNGLDYLVPPSCPLCNRPLQSDAGLCGACWQQVHFITAPICRRTGVPMPVDLGENTISLQALRHPPPYARARAAFLYEDGGARLVRQFKFYDHPEIAPLLASLMVRASADLWVKAELEKSAAWLIPVPLHRRRLIGRRFNQAAELCRALHHITGFTPLFDALVRVRPTRQQVGLTRASRMRNLRGAFQVRPKSRVHIKDRRIILVDDVVTTGTTVEACTRVLKRAGAAQVDVLTAACVVIPNRAQI